MSTLQVLKQAHLFISVVVITFSPHHRCQSYICWLHLFALCDRLWTTLTAILQARRGRFTIHP